MGAGEPRADPGGEHRLLLVAAQVIPVGALVGLVEGREQCHPMANTTALGLFGRKYREGYDTSMATRSYETWQWPIPPRASDEIMEAIGNHGAPEQVEALHHGPISKDEPFLIVRDVSIPRGRRSDGRLAPCPMCQPNKFLEGRLVWFSQLEALAVIGHCCANRETRAAAEREFRVREAKRHAEEYLLETLPKLSSIRVGYEQLMPRAAAAQAAYDQFRKDGAAFQKALRQATKNNGLLTVTEIIGPRVAGGPSGMRTAGSTVETRDVTFGALTGLTAIASQCWLAKEATTVGEALGTLPDIHSDDAVLDFITTLDDAKLQSCERLLRDAQTRISKIAATLNDAMNFYSVANAKRISAWGAHPDAPMRLRASCRHSKVLGKIEFEIINEQGRRVGILLPPAFWPEGKAPAAI